MPTHATISQDSLQPFWDGLLRGDLFAVIEHRDFAERASEVVVVKDQDMRQIPDRQLEIGKRARVAGDEFIGGHIIPAL